MKQINFITLVLVFLTSAILSSCSSDDSNYINENVTNQELNNFFSSKECRDFSTSFDVNVKNFMLDEMVTERYENKKVTSFIIPIEKRGEIVGKVLIFSKNNGRLYKMLYEDRSEFDHSDGGVIKITTAKNKFIASLNCTMLSNQKMSIRINEIAPIKNTIKTRAEFPTPEDGWWDCTTRCYKISKDACGDEAQCNFLCDMADLVAGCTISIAAACAIYCM